MGRQHTGRGWLGAQKENICLCFLPSLTCFRCITATAAIIPGEKNPANPGLAADNRETSGHFWDPMKISDITSKRQ